jgi:hypothetical protein
MEGRRPGLDFGTQLTWLECFACRNGQPDYSHSDAPERHRYFGA